MNLGAGGPQVLNYCSGANKGAAVELIHSAQSWIVDTNAVWSGNGVRRYNRGIVRWPAGWTSTSIQFTATNTPLVFPDGAFAIVVDGVIAAVVTPPANSVPTTFYVTGLPVSPSGSVVEVWEPQNGKPSTQNTGADGPVEGGIVNGVYLPPGQVLTAPAYSTAIINIGDSISGYYLPAEAGKPICYYGASGELRALAAAKGWGWAALDYGGACLLGDGLSSANFITWIGQMVTALGNPAAVKLLYLPFHNDYADNGSSVSTTPTQGAALLQAIVNAFPSYQHIIVTPTPCTSEGAVNTFTLPNWRTACGTVTGATILDSTTFGLIPASDTSDGVHFTRTGGVPKYVAGVRGALGL